MKLYKSTGANDRKNIAKAPLARTWPVIMSSRKDHGPNYPAGPYMLVSFEEENQKGRTRYSVEMNVREARELMEGIEDFLAKYDAGGESKA